MTAKTNAERQRAFEERNKKLGRKGRKLYTTLKEHEYLKFILSETRRDKTKLPQDQGCCFGHTPPQ